MDNVTYEPMQDDSKEEILKSEWDELNSNDTRDPVSPHIGYRLALNLVNLYKNRYSNVLPNPKTRVKLGGVFVSDDDDCSYINANWIESKSSKTKYISTQAPLPTTVSDFWQMIYEQRSCVIVMLTKFKENEREKAHQYWLEKGKPALFSELLVTLTKEQEYNSEIIYREFTIKQTTYGDVHTVVHLHYVGWPDFGKPEFTSNFKRMLTLVDGFHKKGKGSSDCPIVAHCSAGLGRTGTFIAAHMSLEMIEAGIIKSKQDIDLKSRVKGLRKQRRGMVQSIDQYLFLYDVVEDLLQEYLSGEGNLGKSPVLPDVKWMNNNNNTVTWPRSSPVNLTHSLPGKSIFDYKIKKKLRKSCSSVHESKRKVFLVDINRNDRNLYFEEDKCSSL